MEKSVENLKYVIFEEWSYNPPCGTVSINYDACAESYDEMLWVIDEIYEQLCFGIQEDEAEDEEEGEGKEESFSDLYSRRVGTAEYFREFEYDNGGIGCSLVCLAEGKDIAGAVADFIDCTFDLEEKYEYDGSYEETDREELDEEDLDDYDEWLESNKEYFEAIKIIHDAVDNPLDYEKVNAIIDLASDLINDRNDSMY